MKKIVAIVALVAAMAVPANAQVKFGLRGGLNLTSMSFSKSVTDKENRAGFYVGPTVKFSLPLVGLGIDASALYDQREAEVDDVKIKQQAINIPVNVRYGWGLGSLANVFLFAGPQFGFNVGDKDIKEIDWKFKSSNFSINVGVGATLLSHLELKANYNIVCGKTGEVSVTDGAKSVVRGRENAWQIGLAYYF